MTPDSLRRIFPLIACLVVAACLSGCAGGRFTHLSSQDCLARVMYFESNRSSEDGMLAVGTVVMNRRDSGQFPHTVCGVVGQRNQFADGALWKPMSGPSKQRAEAVAAAVLAGDRHPDVGGAMYFHTAGYQFPYTNMHYVLVAGGNAFYEKVRPGTGDRRAPTAPGPVVPAAPPPMQVAALPPGDAIGGSDRARLTMFLATGRGLN